MKRFIISAVGIYRKWLSPLFPGSCRFYPTCSAYALEAVQRYGALRGSLKAGRRILKCNPWHPGGYDPVLPENEYDSDSGGLSTLTGAGSKDVAKATQVEVARKRLVLKSGSVNTTSAPCVPHTAPSER